MVDGFTGDFYQALKIIIIIIPIILKHFKKIKEDIMKEKSLTV